MKAGKKSNRSTAGDPIPLSRGRRWFFRIALLALPFVFLTAAEVCLRLAGYGYNPSFFRRVQIGGADYFVQNEDFGLSFFPKSMVRTTGPLRFPVHKAPGTFRIFILGESAAMGDPAESVAPDRYLEMLLREKYPERKFEVVNTAVTAIDSHVILPIARECAERDGDLWIVYMGNNEMVGPYGAATVFGRQAPSLPFTRLVTASQKLRIGQWLAALGRRRSGQSKEGAAWGGMEMFLNNQVPPASPMRETVYRNFQKNLDDIVRAGVRSGATVLLNTVGVNLRDCPPFAALPRAGLSPGQRAEFELFLTNCRQAVVERKWDAADGAFAQAAHLDDQRADLQYLRGEYFLARTNFTQARTHFQLACDCDALPFRADSRVNAAIRGEPERAKSDRLMLCDAAEALASGSATGICGNETFFEHVHFDFDARYRLARAWADQISKLFPPSTNAWISQAECERQIGLSPWNRSQVIHFMVERMELPPLSAQANNEQRKGALESRIKSELAAADHDRAVQTRIDFEKYAAQRPDDFSLRENYAIFLELSGDIPAAEAQWERFRDLAPQDPLGDFEAGRLSIPLQRYAEAETMLRRTLAIRSSRTDGWIELGNALAMQKKYTEALDAFATALKQDSHDAQTYLRRAKVLGHLSRHAEAVASYRAGLALRPADALIHHELALELAAAEENEAAGPEFQQAAQLNADNIAFRYDYGTWLLRQQQWLGAKHEFEAVLKLDPNNARAQNHIAWLQSKLSANH